MRSSLAFLGLTALTSALLAASGCTQSFQSSASPGDDGGPSFGEDGGIFSTDSGEPFVTVTSFGSGRPALPPSVTASTPPPPISGGTMLVTHDGTHAVAADPDRDVVYGVDLSSRKVTFTTALQPGDEPGRIAEDGAGRVHVALRKGGALVTLDETTGQIVARRRVCPAPRGVAWDGTKDQVWVACATGELVALPSAGGAAAQQMTLERDLRDVLVDNGAVSVTEFRSAQVVSVAGGHAGSRVQLPAALPGFLPHVAWRVIPGVSSGTYFATYQQETVSSVAVQPPAVSHSPTPTPPPPPNQTPGSSPYGGGCTDGFFDGGGPVGTPSPPAGFDDAGVDEGGTADDGGSPDGDSNLVPVDGSLPSASPPFGFGTQASISVSSCGTPPIVTSVLALVGANGALLGSASVLSALPVDVALSPNHQALAVVAAGDAYSPSATVMTFFPQPNGQQLLPTGGGLLLTPSDGLSRQPIAVAFDGGNRLVVQTREPAALWTPDASGVLAPIVLSTVSRADTGIDVFSTQAGVQVACATCHPEGGDDGHVWLLDGQHRRTPSLRGTIQGTAPYHWPGDEVDMNALVVDVYDGRMGGAPLDSTQTSDLEAWVEAIPAPPAPSWIDAASAARGKALFSSSAGCSTCHSGAKLTNNQTMNVGTGGSFQVPPLVGVGWRTPLLHDGCAETLGARFTTCATSAHGKLAGLSAADIADLEMYLESL